MSRHDERVSITLGNGAIAWVNASDELWIRDENGNEAMIAKSRSVLSARLLYLGQLKTHLPETY